MNLFPADLRQSDLVRISWGDVSYQPGPVAIGGALLPTRVRTVGYVVDFDRDFIALSPEILGSVDPDVAFRHVITIPRVNITGMEVLEALR